MSADIEKQLIAQLCVKQSATELEEATLMGNEALLLKYVRFLGDNEIDAKGEMIFNEIQSFFHGKKYST